MTALLAWACEHPVQAWIAFIILCSSISTIGRPRLIGKGGD